MKKLPEELMEEIFQFLSKEDIKNLKQTEAYYALEFLEKTKEYLSTTKDRDWDKQGKAILFFKLAKPENITPQEIVKVVNGFTLKNGASKLQVLKVLAGNKELFETLLIKHKKEIADFVIFPMGMSLQEEKNNESKVVENQQKIKVILGIRGFIATDCEAINVGCGKGCSVS
jgi:hypothetical protein